jgi:hypothetical protein
MKLILFQIKKITIHKITIIKMVKIEILLSKDNLFFKIRLKIWIKITINYYKIKNN